MQKIRQISRTFTKSMNLDRTYNSHWVYLWCISEKAFLCFQKMKVAEKKKNVEVGEYGSQTNEMSPNAFLFGQSELNREDVFIICNRSNHF